MAAQCRHFLLERLCNTHEVSYKVGDLISFPVRGNRFARLTLARKRVSFPTVFYHLLIGVLNPFLTRDWRLNIQHSALLAQDGGALIDDAQGHGFLETAFLCEVSFEQVHSRPALRVKHLLHGQPMGQGEGDRWRWKCGDDGESAGDEMEGRELNYAGRGRKKPERGDCVLQCRK